MKIDGQLLGRTDSPFQKNLSEHVAYVVNRTINIIETAAVHPSHATQADVRRQGHKLAGVWELVSDFFGASNIPEATRREILSAIEAATRFRKNGKSDA